MNSALRRGRHLAGAVVALCCAIVGSSLLAQDAGNRGLTDSAVNTLAGGDPGNGATATSASLFALGGGITRDSSGNIYFTEGTRIMKLSAGVLTVFAGSNTAGYSEGAKGIGARFTNPKTLTIDPNNNLYVWDITVAAPFNNRIRKIAPDGTVTTVAGNGTAAVTTITDIGRPATAAQMPKVVQMAVNAAGDIFFISNGANCNCIYKIPAASGILTIIAGDGTTTAIKTGTVVQNGPLGGTPQGLALLSDGTVAYSTTGPNAIWNIDATGKANVIAGTLDTNPVAPAFNIPVTQSIFFPDDGTKNALQSFNSAGAAPNNVVDSTGGLTPGNLAVDGSTIFFLDTGAKRIRSFTSGGKIQTVFGEISEGGQTTGGGFRGNASPAATNTPLLGVVVSPPAGLGLLSAQAVGGDDFQDNSSRPQRIFSGLNNTSNTVAGGAPANTQVVANAAAATYDGSQRNDDPKLSATASGLVASGGVVTFVDNGNDMVRQFTVGGNVNTVAGATVPFRIQNGIGAGSVNSQAITDATPVPALGAAIFSPSAIGKDATGNFYFDALNAAAGTHNIYKLDVTTNPAAPTVAVIAGVALTNGFPGNAGDGGPAANVLLKGLGSEASLLGDGNFVFGETDPTTGATTSTVRAVSAAGIISTIAGIPGISGSLPTDIDQTLVKNTSVDPNNSLPIPGTLVPVVANRVGSSPTKAPFRSPRAAIGADINDFVVADTGNTAVVIVAGGVITQDIITPVANPSYLAQSGTNLFVGYSGSAQITKYDLTTTPPTPTNAFLPAAFANVTPASATATNGTNQLTAVSSTAGLAIGDVLAANPGGIPAGSVISAFTAATITLVNPATGAAANATANNTSGGYTFSRATGNCRGLAIGTNGMFVFGLNGETTLVSTASLSTAAGVVVYTITDPVTVGTGLGVSGTTVAYTTTGNIIRTFTDTGAYPATGTGAITTVAGQFANGNVTKDGFLLQTHFQFRVFAPLAIKGSSFIVGNDGPAGGPPIEQYLLVTPVAPAPTSTFTVFAGAGTGIRNGGADGESATNAADIGTVGGIAVDSTGALFFSDQSLNTIRRVSGGVITTIGGIPTPTVAPILGAITDGTPALGTAFNKPGGLAFNGADATTIFVAETGNNLVRKITPTDGTGTVTRVAGIPDDGSGAGGDQSTALTARLNTPTSVTFDGNGDLFIAENGSSSNIPRVHFVDKTGIITTLGGGGADTPGYEPLNALEVDLPATGIALDAGGQLYIAFAPASPGASYITRLSGGNAQIAVGDNVLFGFNGDGLPGTQTLINQATGVAFSAASGLVFTDTANNRVRAVTNLGATTNAPPTALIVATPVQYISPASTPFQDTVSFNGSTSTDPNGDIVDYVWNFGDPTSGAGPTANGPTVSHTYTAQGSYTATLTVTDSAGNTSTASQTVIAALPIISSQTNGTASFSVGFGKSANSDSFSLSFKNVANLKNESGKPCTITIGPFSATTTTAVTKVAGGARATTNKNVQVSISPTKKTISVKLTKQKLAAAFASFGLTNANTIGGRSVTVPVVLNFNNGDLVIGDQFTFTYKGKFNGKASGKFQQ